MALFKIFNNLKRNGNRTQDSVSEKLFAFSKDQVRLVLFRECDFRGRKLLFDSSCVQKVSIPKSEGINNSASQNNYSDGQYLEVSDGFGYLYTKPQSDFNQLTEMVFGSVAMSFRGTYFKMHSLTSPNRLMFTQVFLSPRRSNRTATSSRSSDVSEHSKFNDSGASSTISIGEHSTNSDTVLVCRRGCNSSSATLPTTSSLAASNPSIVADSGYCAEQSFSNISSGPSSLTSLDFANASLSSGSLYKKWLRRNSTCLETSFSSGCHEEIKEKNQQRRSKLGLALIVELTPGHEEDLSQFFMEHVVILETMLWRARQVVESAYLKSQNFVSMMVEMANLTTQYLVGLLSDSYLSMNLWLLLSKFCDNFNSINAFSAAISDSMTCSVSSNLLGSDNNSGGGGLVRNPSTNSFGGFTTRQLEGLFNFGKKVTTDWDPFNFKRNLGPAQNELTVETFVQDFCELLETIDVKDTNFFMSTLITAVLTHHLGWVNTVLPSRPSKSDSSKSPFNPLWGELSDLYGALGHPTKMAQTIITGTKRSTLVAKILTTLTYFIRCSEVDRKIPVRAEIDEDDKIVEVICHKHSCIPKENYKTYNDHIREIMTNNSEFFQVPEIERKPVMTRSSLKKSGLPKVQTCKGDLSELTQNSDQYSNITDEKSKRITKLNRAPSAAVLCHAGPNLESYSVKIDMERQKSSDPERPAKVLFVLGDDEKLVGLKKMIVDDQSRTGLKRPSFLDMSNKSRLSESTCDFDDADFIPNEVSSIKPSASWTSLQTSGENLKYVRAQSVPPEDRKAESDDEKSEGKSKYRYSGVKFNLQQYPQILSNYMKSKNLEMTNLQFGDKGWKIDELSSISDVIASKYPEIGADYDESEALQTPSNASELEFTSDIFVAPLPSKEHAKESNVEGLNCMFKKQHVPNTLIREPTMGDENKHAKMFDFKTERKISANLGQKMKVVNLPMPKSTYTKPIMDPVRYTSSLMRAANDTYMPDMVLQAPTIPKQEWESRLRSDLALASQHPPIDQPVEEAVAVIGNIDNWEVQLMSSHTFVIDKGSSGIRVGMSQLVANMLECFLQMWKVKVPPTYCLLYIEQTLQELCVQSKAVAELLLATDFCSMEQLTSTLHLEVNDVPLLLAVASTHSPQVTQKYGVSFQ